MDAGGAILRDFLAQGVDSVFSDGDLDGLVASGLLLRYLKMSKIKANLTFPVPEDLKGLVVRNAILIEMSPTKGLEYRERNLLIDHHGESGEISEYYFENSVRTHRIDIQKCTAARIIAAATGLVNELTPDGFVVMDALEQIEFGEYVTKLAKNLHRAFRLNISDSAMRRRITRWVSLFKWDLLSTWAEQEAEKWAVIEASVRRLVERAVPLTEFCWYFTYSARNRNERAAMREAMIELESQRDIVIAIEVGEDNGSAVATRASIGSKREHVNLIPLFDEIRGKNGIVAGGRRKIGGVQFAGNSSLKDSIGLLRNVMNQMRGHIYRDW